MSCRHQWTETDRYLDVRGGRTYQVIEYRCTQCGALREELRNP